MARHEPGVCQEDFGPDRDVVCPDMPAEQSLPGRAQCFHLNCLPALASAYLPKYQPTCPPARPTNRETKQL